MPRASRIAQLLRPCVDRPDATGQVLLRLKTAWRDSTAHIVMSPLEFTHRLAAGAAAASLNARFNALHPADPMSGLVRQRQFGPGTKSFEHRDIGALWAAQGAPR